MTEFFKKIIFIIVKILGKLIFEAENLLIFEFLYKNMSIIDFLCFLIIKNIKNEGLLYLALKTLENLLLLIFGHEDLENQIKIKLRNFDKENDLSGNIELKSDLQNIECWKYIYLIIQN